MQTAFPNMHDWTLKEIEFDWDVGRITARLESPEGEKELVARDASSFEAPRRHPWGASVSVNAFIVQSHEEIGQIASFEMQSGDTIVIEAAEFSVQ